MTTPPEDPEPEDHPLAGVLDRLIGRERGARRAPAAPSPEPAASPGLAGRRALVVAALGPSGGEEAVLALARWGVRAGRKVVVADLAGPPIPSAAPRGKGPAAGSVPLASLPSGIDALASEGDSARRAALDRLRRHEASGDLLITRVSAANRAVLTRAVFLAGSLVLPVGGGDKALHDAFCLSRDLLECFPGILLIPFSDDASALDLYSTMLRDFAGADAEPFEPGSTPMTGPFAALPEPPREGFLSALLAPDSAAAAAPRILELGSLCL